jgi:hypothetical protein
VPSGINPRDVLRTAKSLNEPAASIAYQELLKSQPRPQFRSGSNQAWDDVPVTSSSGFAAIAPGTSVNYCGTVPGALTFTGDQLQTKLP